MKNIFTRITELQDRRDLVLATVMESLGSTPQKPGSSALFDRSGLIEGTVGGGIGEGKVTDYARQSGKTKKSSYLQLLLNNDISDKTEAICGGELKVLVDADPHKSLPVFEELKESMHKRVPGILITIVSVMPDTQINIDRFWITENNNPSLPGAWRDKIIAEVTHLLHSGGISDFSKTELSSPDEKTGITCYFQRLLPEPQLVIAGAGHIGKALSHIGKLLNFEVTVIDDRIEYANPDNLPDADHIIVEDIGMAMIDLPKRPDTFIVIVTRGHNDDAKALKPCIGSGAGYVGMIGSKAKVTKMHSEFINNKWATEEEWRKIFTPVGLDIKSRTVEEIAISIAAQLIMVKNNN